MTFYHGLKFQRLQPRYRDFSTTLNYGLEFPWPKQKLTDFSMNFHHGPSGTSMAKTKTHRLFHDQALKFLWLKQRYHDFSTILEHGPEFPVTKTKSMNFDRGLKLDASITYAKLRNSLTFPDSAQFCSSDLFLIPYSNTKRRTCSSFSAQRQYRIPSTYGSLSADVKIESRNLSVAAVKLFIARSILLRTSACSRACSVSTS